MLYDTEDSSTKYTIYTISAELVANDSASSRSRTSLAVCYYTSISDVDSISYIERSSHVASTKNSDPYRRNNSF